ncbi:hypothetical protein CCACVL1_10722 [Corchorus capsularis]|uniref:Uncharacterized protein n=1 Tax=Corchorus capsularis TaxID=210143 RepID=A0A1R3IQ38_COCAP|nr:hypothetical protein CCACVL1_10722 [Corchorus capsularis]
MSTELVGNPVKDGVLSFRGQLHDWFPIGLQRREVYNWQGDQGSKLRTWRGILGSIIPRL